EDRHKFSAMLDTLGIDQPRWRELTDFADIESFVAEVGFPVLVRPSYVLSGAAMNVCWNSDELHRFLRLAANVSKKHPVVVTEFVQNAKEIEMDAVADGGEIKAYAISEHIEYAGVHSGDATIQFPPQKLYVETMRRIKKVAGKIARELNISGPFNIQFLAKNNDIIDLATRIMLGEHVEKPSKSAFDLDYVGVKASQFSFSRLGGADPVLGVDMASTGEVGCLGDDTDEAVLKSLLAVGLRVPHKAVLLSTGTPKQKADMLEAAHMLHRAGLKIYATSGTCQFLNDNGIPAVRVYWPSTPDMQPQAIELLHNKQVDLVVNMPKNFTGTELSNGRKIRRAAVDLNIPLLTNSRLASAFIRAFTNLPLDQIEIKCWEDYK
ncbi:ATP-grasp domain-containing protein, partial [Muribaculum intestinale]|uniref:ATP-binding protein n=1 Tax=Muribaculum intestinale TaxID=1796646 RepID=UPI0025B74BEF